MPKSSDRPSAPHSVEWNAERHLVWRRWFIRTLFVIVPAVIGIVGLIYKLDSLLVGYEARPFSLYERILSQIHILFYYIQLILLPNLSEFSLYHDDFPIIREFGWGTFVRLASAIGVLSLCVVSVVHKKRSMMLFGVAWFAIAHAMESTILPLEMIFEHRNYLALYGVSLSLSMLLIVYIPKVVKLKWCGQLAAGGFCIVCMFVLSVRVSTWESAEKLTLVNVIDHPKSARAHNARANLLARYGRTDRVLEHLNIAYKLQPWNSGGAIHILSAACVFKILTPEIKEQAMNATQGAYLTAYTWLATENLIGNLETNRCDLKSEEVFALLDTLGVGVNSDNEIGQSKKAFFTARYHQLLGDVESASHSYDKAILGDPKTTAYAVYKIRFLIEYERFEEAKAEIMLLIEKDKDSIRDETTIVRSLLSQLISAKLAATDTKS